MIPKMKKLIHTCHACPAQWEGQDDLGHWYYFRYRWDCLSVYRSEKPATELVFETSDVIKSVDSYTGNGYSGAMTEEELKELTADIIDWSSELQRDTECPV